RVSPPTVSSLLCVIQYFLVGFLNADVYLSEWKSCPKRHWPWDVIGALAWLSVLVLRWQVSIWNLLLPVAIFFAYLGAFRGPVFNRLVRNGWLVLIGGMCYTIYLYHPFSISLCGRLLLRCPFMRIYWIHLLCLLVVAGLVSLVFCSGLFALLEKPFSRRYW